MALATAYTPASPVAATEVTLSVTRAAAGATARWTLVAVPVLSTLVVGPLVDVAGVPVAVFTPDVAGNYTVSATVLQHYHGHVGGYEGAPSSAPRDVVVGSVTGTVAVGTLMQLPIATTRGDGATLSMTVVGSTVTVAELGDPTTELGRVAMADPTTATALAALVGVTVAGLDLDFATDVRAMRAAYEVHRQVTAGTVHAIDDRTNVVQADPAYSVASAIDELNTIASTITAHMVQGATGGVWHTADDTKNALVTKRATTLAGATVLKADLRNRVYRRHLSQTASPASHGIADATGGSQLAAPLPLPALIVAFLDALVSASPTTPSSEDSGANDAAHLYGFVALAS